MLDTAWRPGAVFIGGLGSLAVRSGVALDSFQPIGQVAGTTPVMIVVLLLEEIVGWCMISGTVAVLNALKGMAGDFTS